MNGALSLEEINELPTSHYRTLLDLVIESAPKQTAN